MTSRGSVIVPAHNEAAVIERTLLPLRGLVSKGEVELLVICNGCTDDTAVTAASIAPEVVVVEIGTPSKSAAIRLGDTKATGMPRIYLDADIEVTAEAILATLDYLAKPGRLAARPAFAYDSSQASFIVRSYYDARAGIPALHGSLWGAGIYGLSAEGRSRFDEFPDLVADDLWLDRQFERDDVAVVATQPVIVRVPNSIRGLIRTLRRVYTGNAQVAAKNSSQLSNGRSRETTRSLYQMARTGLRPALNVCVYVAVTIVAKTYAALPHSHQWERDSSTRQAGER